MMATWQPSAARSASIGSRSRKPRELAREIVQKSRRLVWNISAWGSRTRPTSERSASEYGGA